MRLRDLNINDIPRNAVIKLAPVAREYVHLENLEGDVTSLIKNAKCEVLYIQVVIKYIFLSLYPWFILTKTTKCFRESIWINQLKQMFSNKLS